MRKGSSHEHQEGQGIHEDREIHEEQGIHEGLAGFPDDETLWITEVERLAKPRGRYLISFGPYTLSVHEDVLVKYRMVKGNAFTKQELEEIVVADERQQAYVEGLKALERKPRTRKEIEMKLRQKGIETGSIEYALNRLVEERLVDDESYARQWAQQRIRNHRKGKAWIRQELQQKGVDKSIISEALAEVSSDQEFEAALAAGRKKWNQTKGEAADRKRKTGAYLMRRGYSGEQVRKVINQLLKEDAYPDDEEEYFSFD
ncbi:regulatory protein RecX [Paenibacillus cellulositrophicus]|uniref:regulatory protein RecX n=1 Tax=Paenibacillus cellulositrophicus TaxID=562959 RepID=UPI003F7F8773